MSYLLLLLMPFAIAAGGRMLREHSRLVAWVAAATTLVELALVLQLPVDAPASLAGETLALTGFGQIILANVLVVATASFALWAAHTTSARGMPAALCAVGSITAAVLIQSSGAAVLLLWLAGLSCLPLLAKPSPQATELGVRSRLEMAFAFVAAYSIGAALLFAGLGLLEMTPGRSPIAAALAAAGFALWFGLVPFHLLIPSVAGQGSMSALGIFAGALVLGVLNLLIHMLSSIAPDKAQDVLSLLFALASLTIMVAPVMACGAPRRIVALLLAGGLGQLVWGLTLATPAAIQATAWGVPAYALAVTLLCASAGLLEGGMLRGRRLASISLSVGLLVLVGVPPFGGWTAKVLLWQAAREIGSWALAIIAVGEVALVAAAVRLVRVALLGVSFPHPQPPTPNPQPLTPNPSLRAFVLLLMVVAVLLGAYPAPIAKELARAARGVPSLPTAGGQP